MVKNRAGLGWVEGVIGIPSADDTLCVPGQRIMHPVKDSQPKGLNYDICNKCKYRGQDVSQGKVWLGPTPFKVQVESEGNMLHVQRRRKDERGGTAKVAGEDSSREARAKFLTTPPLLPKNANARIIRSNCWASIDGAK
jgi:hypothetical protein